ncbi:MAG TPA: hypothetical protein VLG10_08120 [Methylomirabilota bacterium]|nr:hypothetical protein [Methylomirabilota bacterium]
MSSPVRGDKFGCDHCLQCGQPLEGMMLTYAVCPCCQIERCSILEEHEHTDAQGNPVKIAAARTQP